VLFLHSFYGETGLYSSLFCIKTSEQVLMVFYKEGRIDYFSKESKKEIEAHTYNVFDFGEQIEQVEVALTDKQKEELVIIIDNYRDIKEKKRWCDYFQTKGDL
jgi:uncharacterized membrane-anchored protein YitT (DUF2179 family)